MDKPQPIDVVTELVRFTGLTCDWQLQKRLVERFRQQLPESFATELGAFAQWKCGDRQTAFDGLEAHMLRYPYDRAVFGLYRYLLEQSYHQGFYGYHRPQVSETLSLESLSPHHVDEFFWQYWDPDIAELCCLPRFTSKDDWINWLNDEYALGDQTLYAVIHKEWGFIGAVCLIQHKGIGFFYYWLGKDFQGRGLGREAASLLIELAGEVFDIERHYAKVFDHNLVSQKLLRKLGFQPVPLKGAAPNDNEQFYYLGEGKPSKDICLELNQLLKDMKATTKVNLPLAWVLE